MSEAAVFAVEPLDLSFCGEHFAVHPDKPFSIGREGDLAIDDNPYLHRRLIELHYEAATWWISNVGNTISIGLSGGDGAYQAWAGPGIRVPLVFPHLTVLFSAGPVTYELFVTSPGASFRQVVREPHHRDGSATIGQTRLTPSQQLLVLALAEPLLKAGGVGLGRIPTSAEAAARLRWPVTTFNRKLDNVCDKLDRNGVPGLRGGVGNLAVNRKARLVEYAILSRLVSVADLALLDSVSTPSSRLPLLAASSEQGS